MYKILIVDDESLERKALRSILSENIPLITLFDEASDGQRAIEKAKEVKPHIVLMDIQMPLINGVDASREIIKILPECRIILMSGYTYFSYAREAVSIGLQDFLVKPLDDDELIASVQALVDGLEIERNQQKRDFKAEKIDRLYNYYEREFIDSQISGKIGSQKLSRYMETLEIIEGFFLGIVLTQNGNISCITEKDLRIVREIANISFTRDRIISSESNEQIYILILLSDFRANLVLQEQLKAFMSFLDKSLPITFYISSGSIKSSSKQIFESFNEARRAIRTDMRISIFQHPLAPDETIFPLNDEEKLCEFLMKVDRQNSLAYLGSIYSWIDRNTIDSFHFKIRIYDLLVILNRRVMRELDPGESFTYFREIEKIDNRDEIKTYLINLLHSFLNRLEQHYSSSGKVWKKQIIQFVDRNFKKSISLEDLANIAGFSAPYLSRIFKDEFGMNFSSYIHSLRIREAKNLLRQSDLSIKEISYELGFSDSNYFARVFKKTTGISASQYQNNPDFPS